MLLQKKTQFQSQNLIASSLFNIWYPVVYIDIDGVRTKEMENTLFLGLKPDKLSWPQVISY